MIKVLPLLRSVHHMPSHSSSQHDVLLLLLQKSHSQPKKESLDENFLLFHVSPLLLSHVEQQHQHDVYQRQGLSRRRCWVIINKQLICSFLAFFSRNSFIKIMNFIHELYDSTRPSFFSSVLRLSGSIRHRKPNYLQLESKYVCSRHSPRKA